MAMTIEFISTTLDSDYLTEQSQVLCQDLRDEGFAANLEYGTPKPGHKGAEAC